MMMLKMIPAHMTWDNMDNGYWVQLVILIILMRLQCMGWGPGFGTCMQSISTHFVFFFLKHRLIFMLNVLGYSCTLICNFNRKLEYFTRTAFPSFTGKTTILTGNGHKLFGIYNSCSTVLICIYCRLAAGSGDGTYRN